MKKTVASFLCIALILVLFGCDDNTIYCEHYNLIVTNCTEPRICNDCGRQVGLVTDHIWEEATCVKPKTCSVCGEQEGGVDELKHDWEEATCVKRETCSVCGKKDFTSPLKEHDYGLFSDEQYCTVCGNEQPDYFVAKNYGFENTYGCDLWIEVDGYLKTNGAYHIEDGYDHAIYRFSNNVFYRHSRYENAEGTDHKNLTQRLSETIYYQVINNDSILIDGETWTIYQRVDIGLLKNVDKKAIVLKVKLDRKERWFILADSVDWEKSPVKELHTDGQYRYTYYFKK